VGGGEGTPHRAALLRLQGLLAWSNGQQADGLMQLEASAAGLLAEAEDLTLGLDLFGRLEAVRVLAVVGRLVEAAGVDPRQSGEAAAPVLAKSIRWVGG
jgi:hypothetical protein